jgi:hypothetical protein
MKMKKSRKIQLVIIGVLIGAIADSMVMKSCTGDK